MNEKAVGYVRVATMETEMDGFKVDMQNAGIKNYCKLRGIQLVDTFSDLGVSGTNIENSYWLKRAIEHAIKEQAKYLIVMTVSRIGRRLTDLREVMDVLEEQKISLIAVENNIDTSVDSEKVLRYFADVSEHMITENICLATLKENLDTSTPCGKLFLDYMNMIDGLPNVKYQINEWGM